MLTCAIVLMSIFGFASIIQYVTVLSKLHDKEYETQRDFLIALIPGKFIYEGVVLIKILIKNFKEIPKSK